MALGADAAVEAAAGGRARLRLGQAGGSISAKSVGAAAKRAAAASGSRRLWLRWRASTSGLSTTGERLDEAVERETLQEAVDHVRRALRRCPTAVGDRRRAGDGVAGGEDPRHGRLQRRRVGLERPRAVGRERANVAVSAPMPIATIAASQAISLDDALVVLRAEACRSRRRPPCSASARPPRRGRRREAGDAPGVVQLDALGERLVDLPVVRGHLGARLEADHVHLGRAEPQRAARGVDRDVAAADDGDDLAAQIGRLRRA